MVKWEETAETDNSEAENLTFEELTRPIKTVEEKWKLLPHFLKMRGCPCSRTNVMINELFLLLVKNRAHAAAH